MDEQPAEISFDHKLFNYISLLEQTNNELIRILNYCVRLMDQFTEMVPQKG